MAKKGPAARDAARRNTRMRLEQWAKNPTCEANTISAVRNVRMSEVAKTLGLPVTFGGSPFALARGQQFEKQLFANDAALLLPALIEKGVLPAGASGLEDFRLRVSGGQNLTTLEEALERTRDLLQRAAGSARDRRSLPALVAGATVRVPKGILLPEAILIIDVLAVRTDGTAPSIQVGEIKTYPDRGGHTAPGDLASARAQAGIYVHGLTLVAEELEVANIVAVSRRGFLVLSRPGSNRPSVRAGEDLRYQAERARRGFDLLERAAGALSSDLWADQTSETPRPLLDAVTTAPTAYNEQCVSFCDLAPRCFGNACQAGDPVILGANAAQFLGAISVTRAVALMNGETPKNDAEKDLLLRIRETEGATAT